MSYSVFLAGLSTMLSLIVAIGAQNAFVLRQGLRNEHVLAVVLICALSDAVLTTLGVASFGTIALRAPWLDPVMRWGGACFLAWYGARSLGSALRATSALTPGGAAERTALDADGARMPRPHLAEPARRSRHGRPARGDLDPVSGLRSLLRGRS